VADDITRGDLTVREVAFTFDGGDEANVAGEILDILWARRIQTTIFLTGQFIRVYPALVRRMVDEGHEVGNHTDAHPHLTTYEKNHRQQTLPNVTREFLVGQLRRAEESFRRLTGRAMAPYWRAPYGEHNAEIRAWAAEAGYRHISWTRGAGTAEDLDTRDWVADRSSRIYRSREEIATRILEFGRGRPEGLNGGVVLMHLASHRKTDRPHEGLPQLLRTLQGQGYRIVTVSELGRPLNSPQAHPSPHKENRGENGILTPVLSIASSGEATSRFASRWVRSRGSPRRCKPGAGARSSAPCPGSSPATGPATRPCGARRRRP
jgi:peptidoglycan/xylan/chitin deacetylase (PgdA/CDA1 family)